MKNHNWIAVVAGISIVFTFMTVTALVCSVETEGIHESLRGIKELGLAVISDPDQARISTVELRRDIELRLATAGIRVLPFEGRRKMGDNHPFLLVKIGISRFKPTKTTGCHCWTLSAEFYQPVSLVLNPTVKIQAPTWSVASALGRTLKDDLADLSRIQTRVEKLVDMFIEAYLSVNPR